MNGSEWRVALRKRKGQAWRHLGSRLSRTWCWGYYKGNSQGWLPGFWLKRLERLLVHFTESSFKFKASLEFLAVQWLRLHASTTGGMDSIPVMEVSTCCKAWPKYKIKRFKASLGKKGRIVLKSDGCTAPTILTTFMSLLAVIPYHSRVIIRKEHCTSGGWENQALGNPKELKKHRGFCFHFKIFFQIVVFCFFFFLFS